MTRYYLNDSLLRPCLAYLALFQGQDTKHHPVQMETPTAYRPSPHSHTGQAAGDLPILPLPARINRPWGSIFGVAL